MFGYISMFGLKIPPLVMIGIGIAAWVMAKRAQSRRKAAVRGRMGKTSDAGLLSGVPSQLRVLASLGEGGRVTNTLGTLTLRTTFGLRLVWLLIAAILIALLTNTPELWQLQSNLGAAAGTPPAGTGGTSGFVFLVVVAGIILSAVNVFGFELRMDRQTLSITRNFYTRRDYAWKDLTGIKDNGQYDYVLTFRDGKSAKVTKYLVGMPQLLKFIGDVLEQNEAPHARTARS